MKTLLSLALLAALPVAAGAQIRITEWMYSGVPGEYVELSNIGSTAVDLTGWSFDDDSRTPGGFSLSGFGVVAPGESVLFTEATPEDFRAAWSLDLSVKVLGGVLNNLGRNDEINIFDASNQLVDRLTYGDQTFSGTIRTQDRSGNPNSLVALGANDPSLWSLASEGDAFGSVLSTGGGLGNPGEFALVPEPATAALVGLGLTAFVIRLRRRK